MSSEEATTSTVTDAATAASVEDNPSASAKRPVDDEEDSPRAKRPKQESDTIIPERAPIYLFATTGDVQARQRHPGRDHWSRQQCWTLREMLGLGDDYGGSFVPSSMGPIDFMVIANYIINFEFLLDECPELLSLPRAVCIYGSKEGSEESWRQACTTLDGTCSVDFVCRNPADPPRTPHNPLQHRIPYGVHHTKLFLVGFSSGILRVVISTANLRYADLHHKTQGAYIQDFQRKGPDTLGTVCDFEESLLDYLDSYRYNQRHKWDFCGAATATTLTEHLKKYDFSTATVVLIPSVPGYHKVSHDHRNKYGHWKLRQEVAKVGQKAATTTTTTTAGPITCQFSSIGSLTKKYLHQLAHSMDIHAAASGAADDDDSTPLQDLLRLVYPTSDEICNSLEGYRGGNSVPGTKRNVSKDFLRPLYRQWSAPVSFLSSLSFRKKKEDPNHTNPLWKGTNVPHIKTYFQLCNHSDDAMEWFLIGSHNLSKAAWGDVVASKVFGEKRFFLRHWELAVFLAPERLRAQRLVPWTPQAAATPLPGDVTIPLPYRIQPLPYKESDRPWAVDERQVRLDIFGRRSASDA